MSAISPVVQIANICRTCLAESENMKSIFDTDSSSGETLQLFEMLMACTSAQVERDDGLPAQICLSCINYMARSYCFKKLCEDSDSALRAIVQTSRITNVAGNKQLLSGVALRWQEGVLLGAEDVLVDPQHAKSDTQMKKNVDHLQPQIFKVTKGNRESPCDAHQELLSTPKGFCRPTDKRRSVDEVAQAQVRSGQRSSNPDALAIHTKIHTAAKEHICPVCNKGLTTRYYLLAHQRIHNGKQMHVCSVCNRCFIPPSRLPVRMRTPYVCTACGKVFSTAAQLKRHQLVRAGAPTTAVASGVRKDVSAQRRSTRAHLKRQSRSVHSE